MIEEQIVMKQFCKCMLEKSYEKSGWNSLLIHHLVILKLL